MSFIADKQTLEDLNILGKYNQHSIFRLFNQVKTAGGEQLLQQMFQNPFTDAEAINRRSEILKYFQRKQTTFPFSHDEFGIMENYLSGSSGNSYLAVLTALARKKLLAAAVRDEEYLSLQNGLRQTIAVLYHCKIFIRQLEKPDKKEQLGQYQPFYEEMQMLRNIFNDPKLSWLEKEQASTTSYSLVKTAKYEHLLRYTMRPVLQLLMEIFYKIDVYLAVANLAKEKDFNYATAMRKDANLFSATELRHPNIKKAVGNTITLHSESNMIFLTGANMAGKSTFMKAFSINLYLAHMGFPVAASRMEFSVKQGIYSSINVPDSLDMGYSHFYAEVIRVKRVAEEVSRDKNLVVIFDELFKGTNVKDAYDATLAVTEAFSEYRNCMFIISTHIIEAGEMLKKNSNIQSLYLPTVINGTKPTYTYQLQHGTSSDRHGMRIIENEGILKMLEDYDQLTS